MTRLMILIFLCTGISAAVAQQPFDSVTVKRIKPADLPGPEETVLPNVLRGAVLPRIPRTEEIDRMYERTRAATLEVIAEFPPVSSLQKTPLILRGQAVWISALPDGSNPILVTPAHWVDGSKQIKVRPPRTQPGAKDLPMAKTVELTSLTSDKQVREILKDPAWKTAQVLHIDKHRNLAALKVEGVESPSAGLTFFPVQRQSPTYLYGVSALLDSPRMVTILQTDPNRSEIIFYLISDFPVSLGAPIVTPESNLVALTALPHPEEPHLTLIVPPLALQRFVETVQGIYTPILVEPVDDAP